MKKRYLILGIVAVELMALPAAAQMVDRVVFDIKPKVTAVEIPTPEAGKSRFLAASNAPFHIQTSGIVGDISVSVHKSGDLNGTRFGDNAQLPGPSSDCTSVIMPRGAVIYQAEQKTAQTRGPILSQAVIFEFNYDAAARPAISFTAGESTSIQAMPCAGAPV